MLNKKLLLSVLFVIFLIVIGVTVFKRDSNVQASNARIHKNELPEHGLFIVNSTDATYENDFDDWLQGKNEAFRQVANTLKPFSIFMKNTSNKDVLAYKLNWELKMSDGRVVNYPRTYFSPDYLMGVPRSDLYDRMMGSIKKNRRRFFTMIPTPLETDGGSSGVLSTTIQPEEIERFQEAGRKGDITPFIARITEQANQATDITVSIENILFD